MKIEIDPLKNNPRSPGDESTPLDSADLFSVRWIDEPSEDFAEGDIFDAYEDADGKVYGLSLRGEWLPIGPEGQSWEWANYGGLKKPKGGYIPLDTLGRSAYREKEIKKNGWKARVRDVYVSVDELLANDETYGILRQLKWDGTVEELWEANPILSGSVTPGKLRIVKERDGRMPKNAYFVYTRDGSFVAGPISKTGAMTRTHHNADLVYYVAQDARQVADLKRGIIPAGLYASSAKPNGFRHGTVRPYAGGSAQYHVHFEDEKGVNYYVTGTRDKEQRVQLSKHYSDAMKFTAQRAAQLAKRLDRLYKNVRRDGGRFYAVSAVEAARDAGVKVRKSGGVFEWTAPGGFGGYGRTERDALNDALLAISNAKPNGRGEDYFNEKTGRRLVISTRKREDVERDLGIRITSDTVSDKVWNALRRGGGRLDVKLNPSDFSQYTKRDCLAYIRRMDPNGYETLEGDESLEQLREACRLIANG